MEKASLAQGKQILDLLSSASVGQVQNLVEGGDLIQIMMDADLADIKGVDREQFRQLLKVIVNPYAGEQCTQTLFYPVGTVPALKTQAECLQNVLGLDFELTWPDEAQNMPFATGEFGADSIGLWPTFPTLGRVWDIAEPRGAGYGKVIATICTKFDEWNRANGKAPLINYRMQEADELTQPDYVRIVAEVLDILVPLEDEAERQSHTCLAMPVNLGDWGTKLCYSPRNALWQTLHFEPKRLAIEPVAGLSLVIGTSVLTGSGQQWKIFPGAQYNWRRDGSWSYSLYLGFNDDKFYLFADEARYADGLYGTPFALPGVLELAS